MYACIIIVLFCSGEALWHVGTHFVSLIRLPLDWRPYKKVGGRSLG
jgi:hypothetical protein